MSLSLAWRLRDPSYVEYIQKNLCISLGEFHSILLWYSISITIGFTILLRVNVLHRWRYQGSSYFLTTLAPTCYLNWTHQAQIRHSTLSLTLSHNSWTSKNGFHDRPYETDLEHVSLPWHKKKKSTSLRRYFLRWTYGWSQLDPAHLPVQPYRGASSHASPSSFVGNWWKIRIIPKVQRTTNTGRHWSHFKVQTLLNYNKVEARICAHIRNRKYDIEVYSKDLYLRYVEDTPASEARPTLLIQTTKDSVFNAAKQRKCVAELYEMLRGMKVSGGTSMITVEMIGYKFWAPKEITLVESDNPFHKVWESELQEMFLKLLDTPMALRGKILSVDLVRLGHNLEDRNINPIVVSITTDWSVDPPQYETVERAMRLALSEAGFDEVEIEFERGHLPLGVTEAPQLKMLTSKEASCPFIRPGSSISCGIARNSDQSTSPTFTGTIGVILELHKPGSNKVEATIALTNHHVVRTGLPGFTAPSEAEIRKLVWPPATLNSVCSSKFMCKGVLHHLLIYV